MAGQSDGSIIIDTALDLEGFEAGSAKLFSACKSLCGTVKRLQGQMQKVGEQKIATDEYKQVQQDILQAEKYLTQYNQKRAKLSEKGKSGTSEWDAVTADIKAATAELSRLRAMKAEMEQSGTAYISGTQTMEYQNLNAALMASKQQLAEMQAQLAQVNSAWARMPTLTGTIKTTIQNIGNAIRSAFSTMGTVITHPLQAADRALGALVQKVGQFVQRIGKAGVSKLVSHVKSAAAHVAKMALNAKSMKAPIGGLTYAFRHLAPALLMTEGVLGLLRKAVNAYMQQNQQLAANLNACWSGIGNILGPIINRLVGMISTAVSYLTQFLALFGLVGKSTSKAISKAGSGASKEADKLKRQLASFDELTVLAGNEEDTGGGAAGGGNVAAGEIPEVTLPDWVQLIADHMKAGEWGVAAELLTAQLNGMIDSVEWAAIGANLAYWIDGALTFFATAITTFDWNSLGAHMGTMLNNLITGVDWGNLGVVLGAKFIALLGILGGLLTTVKWDELGKALADGFMGLWNSIDWGQAARTLSGGLAGALNALSSVIKNVNWQKLGNDIAAFVAAVDYGGVFSALTGGIGAALGGLSRFLLGLVEGAWASVVEWWYRTAYKDGTFTMEGLLLGIWDGICGIGKWIKDNIFNPFIKGFKEAFGIASPSKVMAEQGDFIVAGLLKGVTDAWEGITRFFSDAVSGIKKVFTGEGWANIGSNITSGIKNGISNGWSTLTSWVKDKAKGLLNAAKSALGIHSPSRLFRDQVGLNIGLGIGEGLDDSAPAVLNSVTSVADAIASEFNAGEYRIGGIVPASSIDGALDVFSDKISNSFTSLLDRLQTIADSMSFSAPSVALGAIVPYSVQTGQRANSFGASTAVGNNDDLAAIMEDVVKSNIAGHETSAAVLREILNAVLSIELDGETLSKAIYNYRRKEAVSRG